MLLNFENTTLPFFRVGGISVRTHSTKRATDVAQLWQQQRSGSLNDLMAFSSSLYCVYHDYAEDGSVTALLGKLISTDTVLPDDMSDVWIAPQHYAVFTQPDKDIQAALLFWQKLEQQHAFARRKHADFECYPTFGATKIYVGLPGEVVIEENESIE